MQVIGFAGYSGSGKTTLLEKMIPRLVAAGLDVAVVKHTHHDVDWDVPGKDSYRHRQAGARQVMLAAGQRRLLVETLPGSNDLSLADHVARLAPCDLVLAEGFKHAPVPKIEVINHALGSPRLFPDDPMVIAVVADGPVDTSLPYFQRDDVDALCQFLLDYLNRHVEHFPLR
ncbi:molybdopterin-guanine dinucleotide biosynthesis protein B [Crenobacter sp. SG2303]|uniref:Molybdopterin-guanine dinucleotide biosynthesis protein B n=1 Tax=Crenobacter oryzisoli TaxID=3056844 RepID=A0ABT7XNL8_9NEIS|nr:molybdopterin-guanine dinucleotide biosynthesis protein B [Crenobacter sp. SG2303]MDN0075387.1 molybdopterin-guanine dinucleotide biosynthesis protein B [Crenobacter sp. SG2303]